MFMSVAEGISTLKSSGKTEVNLSGIEIDCLSVNGSLEEEGRINGRRGMESYGSI